LGHLSQLGAAKFNLKNNETFLVISFRVPGVPVAKIRMVLGDTNHGYSSKWNNLLQLWPAACRLGHLSQLGAAKFKSKNNKTFRVISFRVPGVSVAKIRMVLGDTNHGCKKITQSLRLSISMCSESPWQKKRTVRGDKNHGYSCSNLKASATAFQKKSQTN